MHLNRNNRRTNHDAVYFNSFEVENFTKDIITNIYRIEACYRIMCGHFCIGCIDFIVKRKRLPDHTNLFSPNDYEKNDKIILKYFQ